MDLARAAWKVLSVRRSELRFTLPLFLLYLLSGSFYAVGQIYTETMFLKAYGASGLSRFFVYNGIALMVAGVLYNYVLLRFSLRRGYLFLITLFSGLIFLSLLPAARGYSWLPFYLFLGNYLFTFYLDIHFFNYSYQFLSIRSSKRLIPLLMGGGKLGGILASLIMVMVFRGSIADYVGTWWFVNGVLLLAPVFVMGMVSRGAEKRWSLARNDPLPDARIVERVIKRIKLSYSSPIFAVSVLAVFVMAIVNQVAEYYFAVIFNAAFPSRNELAWFLSVYTFAADLLTLVVQVIITSRLIQVLGIWKANYIYPGSFMAFMALMFFSPGLLAGIFLRFFRKSMSAMFRHPVFNVIIASAPRDRIAEVKSFIGGIIQPLGMMAGGGAILLIYKKLPAAFGFALAAAMGCLYIALTFFQNRAYVRSLKNQLSYDFGTGADEAKEGLDLAMLGKDSALVEMNLPMLDALFREKPDSELIPLLLPYFSELSRETREGILGVVGVSRRDLRERMISEAIADRDPLIRGRALGLIKQFPYEKRLELLQGYPSERLEAEQIALEALLVNEADSHGDGDIEASSFVVTLLTGEKPKGRKGRLAERIGALREKVAVRYSDPVEFLIIAQVLDPELYLDDLLALALATKDVLLFRAIIPHAERLARGRAARLLYRFRNAPFRYLANFAALCSSLTETDKALLLDYRFDLTDDDMADYFVNDEELREMLLRRLFLKYGFERKSNYLKCLISLNVKPRDVMIRLIRRENDAIRKAILLRRVLRGIGSGKEEMALCARFLDLVLRNEIDLRKQLVLKAIGVLTGTELDYIYESSIFLRDTDVTSYILEFIESSGSIIRDNIYIFEEETLESQAAVPMELSESGIDPAALLLETKSFMPELADLTAYAAAEVLLALDVRPAMEDIFRQFRKPEESDMLNILGKILFLKGNLLFSDIDINDLIHIARITGETEMPANKIFIRENDPGEELFIVVDGEVEVLVGKSVIETLGNGACIGELSIIDREPRSASVRTRRRTRLLSINRKDFLLTLKQNPSIAINVMKVITQRLRKSIAK